MSDAYLVAPAQLFRGPSAIEDAWAGLAAAGLASRAPGSPRVLVVEGEVGRARLGTRWDAAISTAGVRARSVTHQGPCTEAAIRAVADASSGFGADAIAGVGGGRVLDVAKGAADLLGIAFAAFPTSPATCAAVTPLVVRYDADGRFLRSVPTRASPSFVALDPSVLADVPDRLLAAGILDALAKVYEVRHTSGDAARRSATAGAALVLCDGLDAAIHRDAGAAFARYGNAGSDSASDPASTALRATRGRLAEACVLTPGIIGGLAGADAKLAAAHPVHNALTMLPGSHGSLHGEIVGFGILTQLVLAGRSEGEVRNEARRYLRLGANCSLEALGCAEATTESADEVAAAVLASAPFRAAFPDVGADALLAAMRNADAWASEEVRQWPEASAGSVT